jgi:hypothetical protein
MRLLIYARLLAEWSGYAIQTTIKGLSYYDGEYSVCFPHSTIECADEAVNVRNFSCAICAVRLKTEHQGESTLAFC